MRDKMDFEIDTDKTPEAKCLLDYCESRQKKNLGAIGLFVGGGGSGKSFSGTRFLELWYERIFKEEFPITHICETLEQAVLIVKDFRRKGEGILIEELSVLAGSRDSLTTINKLWNKFVDVVRIKQAIIIANCPHLSFIDKHFRLMCNFWVDCLGVDFEKKIVVGKPLWLQFSQHKAEPYRHKFVNDEGLPIDYCYFRKPSPKIVEEYNKFKDKNVNVLYDEIALKMQHDRIQQLKKLGGKIMPERQRQAYELWLKGYSSAEGTKIMGLKHRDIFNEYVRDAKEKLNKPEYASFAKEMRILQEKVEVKRFERMEAGEVNSSGGDVYDE